MSTWVLIVVMLYSTTSQKAAIGTVVAEFTTVERCEAALKHLAGAQRVEVVSQGCFAK